MIGELLESMGYVKRDGCYEKEESGVIYRVFYIPDYSPPLKKVRIKAIFQDVIGHVESVENAGEYEEDIKIAKVMEEIDMMPWMATGGIAILRDRWSITCAPDYVIRGNNVFASLLVELACESEKLMESFIRLHTILIPLLKVMHQRTVAEYR